MTASDQQRLGKTLWAIADQLRGAMAADDFRDYMLAFLFLRYLSDILPHGVLFRGGAEERIRTKLLKDGHIDTVIGLPANLF
jgi:type I restriction-modification system DNA methylase subunit